MASRTKRILGGADDPRQGDGDWRNRTRPRCAAETGGIERDSAPGGHPGVAGRSAVRRRRPRPTSSMVSTKIAEPVLGDRIDVVVEEADQVALGDRDALTRSPRRTIDSRCCAGRVIGNGNANRSARSADPSVDPLSTTITSTSR